MVLLGGRSSPPVPPSPKERGASRKGEGGKSSPPVPPSPKERGASWKGEGASWKGDGGVLLLGYYSVDGVLVMFIVSIATTLLLGRGWGRIVL